MDQPIGTSEARDRLPSIIQAAERGHTTYITRRGAHAPVAAVVPATLARENTQPPETVLPSAPGGTFAPAPDGSPSEADRDWTGAALAGAHHHLVQVVQEASQALSVVGAALATHAAGDTEGARDLLSAAGVERTLARLGGAEIEALDLYYALTARGPLECDRCGHGLTPGSTGEGLVHVEPDGSGGWRALHQVDHAPAPRHLPPARPGIRNGSVDKSG